MTIIKFPTPGEPNSEFFKDIVEEGYHVFSLKNAKIPGYYPSKFPDYPGVNLSDLTIGDTITIRVFFRVGTGEDIRADGGYIDLDVEFIEEDKVMANITTLLPKNFPLGTGTSLEVFEEEILYKGGQFKVHWGIMERNIDQDVLLILEDGEGSSWVAYCDGTYVNVYDQIFEHQYNLQ